MIISKTPYRISFFGGGTDYHTWYEKHGGCILSTTIDKFCYITARRLPPFFENKSRVVWSKIEEVDDNADIEHNSVKACLKFAQIKDGVEIHHMGDLPARSGLGSSSSFTVGMINALRALEDYATSKRSLSDSSIWVERVFMKENVGIQDQIAASFGGFNIVTINKAGIYTVEPVKLSQKKIDELQNHLLMFFTGISRTASDIAKEQIKKHKTGKNNIHLKKMQAMPHRAMQILQYGRITEFGKLMHRSWLMKKKLAGNISTPFIDKMYDRGIKAGAIGGKLLGAGGGGMMLFFAEPKNHDKIKQELKEFLHIPFRFETEGSQIIYRG